MRPSVFRAGGAALVALSVISFSTVAVAGRDPMIGDTPVVRLATSAPTNFFARLWVYPSTAGALSIVVAPATSAGPQLLVIREESSLLRPADLDFAVQEHGVTVVRGPLAR
jgi:hypothetical protein